MLLQMRRTSIDAGGNDAASGCLAGDASTEACGMILAPIRIAEGMTKAKAVAKAAA